LHEKFPRAYYMLARNNRTSKVCRNNLRLSKAPHNKALLRLNLRRRRALRLLLLCLRNSRLRPRLCILGRS
jgi:hypothetical protein